MITDLLVSVCVITYNHEKYIKDSLISILEQKCNFSFEIIISNDSSTDDTHKIIEEVLKKRTNKKIFIRYYNQKSNIGMMRNFIFALKECKGKYIAICDGDDYWLDKNKLQKQFNFLEKNKDYVIHSGLISKLTKKEFTDYKFEPISFDKKDFYINSPLYSCTIMFRNRNINFHLLKDKNIFFGDWFLCLSLLFETNLKAYRTSEILSVYRNHKQGVTKSSKLIKIYLKQLEQIKYQQKLYPQIKFSKSNLKSISSLHTNIFEEYLLERQFNLAIRLFLKDVFSHGVKTQFLKYFKKSLKIIIFNKKTNPTNIMQAGN